MSLPLDPGLGLGLGLSLSLSLTPTFMPTPILDLALAHTLALSLSPSPGEHCLRVLHSFWLELQRRRREATPTPEAAPVAAWRAAGYASLAPLARVRAGRKSAPPRLVPSDRQQQSQDEEEPVPVALAAPHGELASKVPGQHESSRNGDPQYDGEYY